jgi:hypothetical protein
MGWAGHVACMGTEEVYTGFWSGNLRQGDRLKDTGIDVRIILKLILEKSMDWIYLSQERDMWRIVVNAVFLDFEFLDYIKCGEFFD